MSLDKAIKYGKEKRKPYRGSKAVSCGCRNHGSCDYCRNNRTINLKKVIQNGNADFKDDAGSDREEQGD